MAAAAFMIRDAGMNGADISILEALPTMGGSLDGAGVPQDGYSMRGGRMLTTSTYECTWDLFKSIPSLGTPGMTVYDETIAFNEKHKTHSMARLVDSRGAKVPVTSMGFTMRNRIELLKLNNAPESDLGSSRITDWLSQEFFATDFWFMWATTFAFQPWHSACEFKRYLHRFILEFAQIDTLAGVKRTVFNQYDSFVLPLRHWLEARGVRMVNDCRVVELEHDFVDGKLCINGIRCLREGHEETTPVRESDFVFLQNGSMTDASSTGSMDSAPVKRSKNDSDGWNLWKKLSEGRTGFGAPSAFNSSIAQSCWESFTVTLRSADFFDAMHKFSGNEAGTGGLMTFKDSNWLMSIVLAHQPHFANQPYDVQVFWGYALFPNRVGNFVPKAMQECTGREILQELCGHLHIDIESMQLETASCVPCRMPYITSMFMPRCPGDRPLPVPKESMNLAFVSQFVEIPDDVVFTVEYSVRAAQMAVYELLKVERAVPPVTRHDRSLRTQVEAVVKAFA